MIISASIVKGKQDNYLSWPFAGTIIVTLLNQAEDRNHYNKEIWSATNGPGLRYAGRVAPADPRNPSWCRQGFIISLTQLEGSTESYFLVNDCLYLEVNTSPRKENKENENYCCLS